MDGESLDHKIGTYLTPVPGVPGAYHTVWFYTYPGMWGPITKRIQVVPTTQPSDGVKAWETVKQFAGAENTDSPFGPMKIEPDYIDGDASGVNDASNIRVLKHGENLHGEMDALWAGINATYSDAAKDAYLPLQNSNSIAYLAAIQNGLAWPYSSSRPPPPSFLDVDGTAVLDPSSQNGAGVPSDIRNRSEPYPELNYPRYRGRDYGKPQPEPWTPGAGNPLKVPYLGHSTNSGVQAPADGVDAASEINGTGFSNNSGPQSPTPNQNADGAGALHWWTNPQAASHAASQGIAWPNPAPVSAEALGTKRVPARRLSSPILDVMPADPNQPSPERGATLRVGGAESNAASFPSLPYPREALLAPDRNRALNDWASSSPRKPTSLALPSGGVFGPLNAPFGNGSSNPPPVSAAPPSPVDYGDSTQPPRTSGQIGDGRGIGQWWDDVRSAPQAPSQGDLQANVPVPAFASPSSPGGGQPPASVFATGAPPIPYLPSAPHSKPGGILGMMIDAGLVDPVNPTQPQPEPGALLGMILQAMRNDPTPGR